MAAGQFACPSGRCRAYAYRCWGLGPCHLCGSSGKKSSNTQQNFGFLRAEVLGAFVNGATLVLIVGFIFYEAWQRSGQTGR